MITDTQSITAEDAIYEELYDVRQEAVALGNLVEDDMNPAINALRDRAPVQTGFLRELLGLPAYHRHVLARGRPGYTCLSFKACEAAFRDHATFSSHIMHVPSPTGEHCPSIIEMDQPEHRMFRGTLQPMFNKPRIPDVWRARWIDEIVAALIENLKSRERADLNILLCARLPVHTVTRAIGMEGERAMEFRTALLKTGGAGTREENARNAHKVQQMLLELIEQRREQPRDDVISGMLSATMTLADGTSRKLTDLEIATNARLVMLAGGGTSWRQLGITLWALLTHRDQLEAVKADPRLAEGAVEESVRWNPNNPVFTRLVAVDTELEGVAMPAGAALDICLVSANRDPERWDRPDAFDIHRKRKFNLGFGLGPHQCLGQNVARSEMEVALAALLDAFPNLRLDPSEPEPMITGGLEQRGMSAIPVLLR